MIEVRRLTRRYGPLTAVHDLSFEVRPGEVLGLLGPNGSGKSTTVKVLTGLLPPTTGHVLLDGRDALADVASYKAILGYVPEEPHLYSYMTGPEYLQLVGRLRGMPDAALDDKIERFLTLLGIWDDRYQTLSSYSKGMRQKVLIAAAVLHNPRVVVLDEPVSGLDVSTALVMRSVVRSLAADGRIIFYSSHELETIEKISTRVIILRSGEVVADDSAARLRELMHAPSLEDVFAQLAVKQDLGQTADAILEAVRL